MKNSIKYLLLTAIVGFSFLNVFSKKSGKHERRAYTQPAQTMPQIPNGDFEDWDRWGDLKVWKTNSYTRPSNTGEGRYRTFMKDSISVYHWKYSAKLIHSAGASNKFPISVHPTSLHLYALSNLEDKYNLLFIGINLFKNGSKIDGGEWENDSISLKQWTEITIPISNNVTEVDSALIVITTTGESSDASAYPAFWIDDLFFK